MKIVLTGGPSAGKTSVAEILKRSTPTLAVVEEAAALLFRGGFPRGIAVENVKAQQIAIYHVQKQLEIIAQLDHPTSSLICDRGSLDGLAYWPADEASFFQAIGSTMDKELARYDYVVHLNTAEAAAYQRNDLRIEGYPRAEEINERVKQVWSLHPRRIVIEADHDFLLKAQKAVEVVKFILERGSI